MIDQFSEASKHAAQVREVYDAFRRLGFDNDEALALTGQFHAAALEITIAQATAE
ncbi:hypothetical protein [Streptomyces sp. SM12]|uniref:hypothetical protein n=1 Tax=Streptomyces sp. SM12 TaxID=1071602 RepID=UPI0015E1700A|nr:hypothetical protein [Streptomyces sp. SM12]